MASNTMDKKMNNTNQCDQSTRSFEKMPGHWVLAKLGKRVLRPGGIQLTDRMLESLFIQPSDHVVEFAPGLGMTAQKTVAKHPASYTAIERDCVAAEQVKQAIGANKNYKCLIASAEECGLDDEQATVVYGEAMLTMQTEANKRKIISEAHRILKDGGRYGVHEIALQPADISETKRQEIREDLSRVIHHGVNPLTLHDWQALFESEGFQVKQEETAPMALLELSRMIRDEGLFRVFKIWTRLLLNSSARKRVSSMRSVFHTHQNHMQAFVMVLEKQER